MSAGNPHFYIKQNYNPSVEDANWILEFVISSIINWQQTGLKPELDENSIRGVEYFIENGAKGN